MEVASITFWLAEEIAKYLTRIDCINWSYCSKAFHQLLLDLCHLRLTQSQSQVVQRILQFNSKRFIECVSSFQISPSDPVSWTKCAFPSEFVLASGPSTGKTAIVLYTASLLQRRGKNVFISAPLKLCRQWQGEAEKFTKQFNLPPLCIVHPRFDGNWKEKLQAGHLPIVPDSVLRIKLKDAVFGQTALFLQEFIGIRTWDWAFLDETWTIPNSLIDLIRMPESSLICVGLNASDSSSQTIAGYATDPQLGQLPRIQTFIEHWGSEDYLFGWALIEAGEIGRFIDLYRGTKTLLLSNSFEDNRNSLFKYSVCKELKKRGFVNVAQLSVAARANAIEHFRQQPTGALAAPFEHMYRGFDLACDAVLVLDPFGNLPSNRLCQALGRVRRVGSPFKKVKFCTLQHTPIHDFQLAHHVLATTGNRSLDEIERAVKWVASKPTMKVNLSTGKRRKMSDEFALDRSLFRQNLIRHAFPEEANYIRELSRNKIVIFSYLDDQ
jgi:hypothetical protein